MVFGLLFMVIGGFLLFWGLQHFGVLTSASSPNA